MVKEGKGYNVQVESLGVAKVANPHVLHSSLDEDLDAVLSSLISLVVLDLGSPSSFGAHAVDARGFRVDRRIIACRTGGWVYERSNVVVEVPVCVGNESPEAVDTVDAIVGGLDNDKGDDVGETDEIIIEGLSIDGEKERLGCCKG
jgi:hypothetical protein